MPMAEQTVEIFTDGACKGNPGIGGWGALLQYNGKQRELCGGEQETTNNRMELTAAIRALAALNRPCRVNLHTDSKYVQQGISEWISNWKKRGWKTADRKPVKNEDLAMQATTATNVPTSSPTWASNNCVARGNNETDRTGY